MTTHYEERMEADLAEIRRQLVKVSDLVETQVHDSVQALLRDDRELATRVILGDRQVNRRIKHIDRLCHAFIVRHAPSARHLRFTAAVLRLDVALERIGDYAGSVGREVVRLSDSPPSAIARDIELIAQQARHTLSQALTAFHRGDDDLARETYGLADQLDYTLEKVYKELLAVGEQKKLPLTDIFSLLRIINLVKRVAEQAENICEQTRFAVAGETRDPRVFRILFVDEHNDRSSQLAEAYARKAFPESGAYDSAGWNPTDRLDEGLLTFMDGRGVDMRSSKPEALRPLDAEPEHYHVVVTFSPKARKHLGDVPYRTTVLEWDLGVGPGMDQDTLEALFTALVVRIQDLMTTLAGPDAT